jgi:hypothetical protein
MMKDRWPKVFDHVRLIRLDVGLSKAFERRQEGNYDELAIQAKIQGGLRRYPGANDTQRTSATESASPFCMSSDLLIVHGAINDR